MNYPRRTFLAVAIFFLAATVARARNSQIGKLDEAISRKWIVIDMKHDWKVIYPAEKQSLN